MDKTGRRPDLDSWCSRCVANGMDGAATANLGIGRTIAFFRAAEYQKRRGKMRMVQPAVEVHHCNFHGCEVETVEQARARHNKRAA